MRYDLLFVFQRCQFLEKYRIFRFGQFLIHQKKKGKKRKKEKKGKFGYFAIAEYVTCRHVSRCTFRIYSFIYGYKLFLTSYFCISFIFNHPRETVKQISEFKCFVNLS